MGMLINISRASRLLNHLYNFLNGSGMLQTVSHFCCNAYLSELFAPVEIKLYNHTIKDHINDLPLRRNDSDFYQAQLLSLTGPHQYGSLYPETSQSQETISSTLRHTCLGELRYSYQLIHESSFHALYWIHPIYVFHHTANLYALDLKGVLDLQ